MSSHFPKTAERFRGILTGMRADAGPRDGDEEVLVDRARRGDRQAFDRLVERHLPQVWPVVWRILRNREDADDVVQEVFLAAHQALGEFRGESRFSTWLHRIATTRALNHLDRASEKLRRASLSLDAQDERAGDDSPRGARKDSLADGGPSPLRALENRELMRRLADCFARLPGPWRAVVALRDGQTRSYEDIASILHLAIGTVRSRLARARIALRECVEETP